MRIKKSQHNYWILGVFSQIILFIFISCDPYTSAVELPEKLKGDWMSTDNLHWKLTIQDDFIIYQNSIYTIEDLSTNSSSFRIQLLDSENPIELTLSGDSLNLDGKWLTQKFNLAARLSQPDKPSMDMGTAVIQGYIKDFDTTDYYKPIKLHVHDHVLGLPQIYKFDIDSSGVFSTSFHLNATKDIWISFSPNAPSMRLLASPNDTLTLSIDHRNHPDTVHFMGNTASASYGIYYMAEGYREALPDSKTYNNALAKEPEDFLLFVQKSRDEQIDFLEKYCASQNCSELFKEWYLANTEVRYFDDLMKFSWRSLKYGLGSMQRLTQEQKEKYESQFRDSIDLNNEKYAMSSVYFSLINSLSQRVINHRDPNYPKNNFHDLVSYFQKSERLTEQEHDFLKEILSTNLTSDQFTQQQKEIWWGIEDQFSDELKVTGAKKLLNWTMGEVQKMDNANARDLMITNFFFSFVLENGMYEIMDEAFEEIETQIENPNYLRYIEDIYLDTKQQEANFKSLNLHTKKFEGSGEALIQDIRKNNPDTHIVLDFWATWCKPCIRDFSKTNASKTKLRQKVNFVYLCIGSTERNWKNALSKYNPEGEHYLLSPRQERELRQKYNINSFPTYMLISKNGKLHRNLPELWNEKAFQVYLDDKVR